MTPKLGVMISPTTSALLDRDYVRGLAALLEEQGCESVWLRDHPAPSAAGGDRCFPAPLEWLTMVAAHSTTLKLGTAVIVLPFQHPIVLAKRIATVDRLSNGRMLVGVGIGSDKGEAATLDIDMSRRAGMTTESIEVMRTIWTADHAASFDGRFFSFHNVDPSPRPTQPLGPPISIGGDSVAAARRAGRLGHGLIPLGCEPELIQQLVDVARTEAIHGGWDASAIELTVQFDADRARLERLLRTGATRVIVDSPASGDLAEIRDAVTAAKKALDEAE
jgi:probable F420-dependent oxidoreductase